MKHAYIDGNVYYNQAPHFDREKHYLYTDKDLQVQIVDEGDAVYMEMYVDGDMMIVPSRILSTDMLGVPRIVGQPFVNPDGTNITIDTDLIGCPRTKTPIAGPFEQLSVGYNKIKIWER